MSLQLPHTMAQLNGLLFLLLDCCRQLIHQTLLPVKLIQSLVTIPNDASPFCDQMLIRLLLQLQLLVQTMDALALDPLLVQKLFHALILPLQPLS